MALHFFDIIDGGATRDDTGTECATRADVRQAVLDALPDLARDLIPHSGDRRTVVVVARDENQQAMYTATLTFAGLWLDERPQPGAAASGGEP